MGYSWVFIGDAEIGDDERRAWLERRTDPASNALAGAEVARAFGLTGEGEGPSARALLERIAAEEIACVDLEGPISLRLVADKSGDAWLTDRAHVVAAFAALAELGGAGRLDVYGFDDGPDSGFRLAIAGGKARLSALEAEEVVALRRMPTHAEALALADSVYGAAPPLPPMTFPVAAPVGSYLDHAQRTILGRVLFDARDGLRRAERRVLWALHCEGGADGRASIDAAAGRTRADHPELGHAREVLLGLVSRRGEGLALIERRDDEVELTGLGRAAVAAVPEDDLVVLGPRDAPEPRLLGVDVPWLLIAGGRAIGAGCECAVDPIAPRLLLDAIADRLALPPRAARGIALASPQHVLLGGEVAALDADGLLDAFLAARRVARRRRGDRDDAEALLDEAKRWLG